MFNQQFEEAEEKLREKMNELKLRGREKEIQARALQTGLQYINLKGLAIDPDALKVVPKNIARDLEAICFLFSEDYIKLASVDPESSKVQKFIESLKEKYQNRDTEVFLISEESFKQAFKLYDQIPEIKEVKRGVEISPSELLKFENEFQGLKNLPELVRRVSVSELVSLMIAAALKVDASDIHLEAGENQVKVRFRIDGVLQDVLDLEKSNWRSLNSRIKLLSNLKLNVEDKPQDGAFSIFMKGDRVDVRVSTLPTSFGESVVIRLLRSQSAGLEFEDIGLKGRALEDLAREIERPNGMIVTCGPTGSGKTTTLYAILKKLNTPDTKIITLEDPIEYKLAGITQSQIEPGLGYDFAKGLKSILRQDPDIIMVGEIRDLETAETSINAALTGHLVISTLHTNDAAGAIPRFLALGAKSFLLAPALNAIIAQRLVRKICGNCKEEATLDAETLERVKNILKEAPLLKFYKGRGCDKCQSIGYKGRIGIFEVLPVVDEVEKLILKEDVSEYMVRELAGKLDVITMVHDGLLKALDGITTVEEVFRVTE